MEKCDKIEGDELNSLTIDFLPDDIFTEIFGKLDFDDLCRCSQVSRKWHRHIQSLCVTKLILNKSLTVGQFYHLLENPLITDHLKLFKFQASEDVPTFVNKQIFLKLQAKCHRLKNLFLKKCHIISGTLSDLPCDLKHLCLQRCEMQPVELFSSQLDVTCLDLSFVDSYFTSVNMELISKFKNLKCLYLEDCTRLNNDGIDSIMCIMPQLEILDLEGTDINNEIIPKIFNNGVSLRKLYLGNTLIGNSAFPSILKKQSLTTLCLRHTMVMPSCIAKLLYLFNFSVRILNNFQMDCNDREKIYPLLWYWKNVQQLTEERHRDEILGSQCCKHFHKHVCPT